MAGQLKKLVRPALVGLLVLAVSTPMTVNVASVHADATEAVAANAGLAGQLTLGSQFTCAIVDGKVYCWGDNHEGQTAQTTGYSNKLPVAVPGISTATQVSAGMIHACALLSSGDVWCWGNNAEKQLGRSTGSDTSSPVAAVVSGVSNAIGIATGFQHSCALISGGTVKCWGTNANGQLGTGTSPSASTATPQSVTGISDATRIVAAQDRTCVLVTSGAVKCWGYATETVMGAGVASTSPTAYATPVSILRNSDAQPVTGLLSLSMSQDTACGVAADKTAWCWGSDMFSQIGSGVNYGVAGAVQFKAPNQSQPLADISQIAAGDNYTCMIRTAGVPWCIGENMGGQLGDGTSSYAFTPVLQSVLEVAKTTVVVAATNHTCSIDTDLTVYCWGTGTVGQIGQGSLDNAYTPVKVKGAAPQAITFAELADKSLGSGDFDVAATSSSGQAVSFTSSTTSVCTVSGTTVKLIAAGTCTVVATRGAYGLYAAATDVSRSFKVGGVKPIVTTGTANAQSTKATLNGTVNTGGVDASVTFTYGTDPALSTGTKTTTAVTKQNLTAEDVSAAVSELSENTKYYFRIEASNSVGSAKGDIKSFTTNKPEGVSVNNGDEFTSSQSVTVSVVGPASATKALLSNDGGFKDAQTFDLVSNAADIPWTLQSSKEGTFTKIVYVRFVSKLGSTLSTQSDDIILDTTKPVISVASAASTSSTGGAVTVARVQQATKAKGVKLTLKGSDTISGIGSIEVRSSAAKAATAVKLKSVAGKTDGKPRSANQTVVLATTAKKLQVRVLDRAGNASAWKTISVK